VFAADGYTYERRRIEEWLKRSNLSPVTQEPLLNNSLVSNHQLHGEIEVGLFFITVLHSLVCVLQSFHVYK
jgi:U-box domain